MKTPPTLWWEYVDWAKQSPPAAMLKSMAGAWFSRRPQKRLPGVSLHILTPVLVGFFTWVKLDNTKGIIQI